MKANRMFLVIFCLITLTGYSQKKINNYKYVVVPNRFDFLKQDDQYQTSSLTKFLFKKYGFKVYLDNETLPDDLSRNRCLGLTGVVKDASSLFTTKTFVELRDCNNNVVFTSEEGKSKLKDYKKAYHESIRNAFNSVKNLRYKYVSSGDEEVVETKQLSAPSQVISTNVKTSSNEKVINGNLELLYAQPVTNGFQLIDNKPERVFIALKSELRDVFILKNKNGIIYKVGSSWKAEYFEGEKKITKLYNVKF